MRRQKSQKGPFGYGVVRNYTEKEKDLYIGSLVARWEKEKHEKKTQRKRPFITISRQFGTMAMETAMRLSDRLNSSGTADPEWIVYDKEIVKKIAKDLKMSRRLAEILTESSKNKIGQYMDGFLRTGPTMDEVLKKNIEVVRSLCEKGHTIILGRAGCRIGGDLPQGFHFRIVAPLEKRVDQVASFYSMSRHEAARKTKYADAERKALFRQLFDQNIEDADLYDMVLNQGKLSGDTIVEIVLQTMKNKGLLP